MNISIRKSSVIALLLSLILIGVPTHAGNGTAARKGTTLPKNANEKNKKTLRTTKERSALFKRSHPHHTGVVSRHALPQAHNFQHSLAVPTHPRYPQDPSRLSTAIGTNSSTSRAIVQFAIPSTAPARVNLLLQLDKVTHGSVQLANSRDFKNKNSPCFTGTCALVSTADLALLNSNTNKLPGFSTIGKVGGVVFPPQASSNQRQGSQHSAKKLSAHGAGAHSFMAGHGGGVPRSAIAQNSGQFGDTNSNTNTNYIPDLGTQDLGAWFPARNFL